ncbi:SdpI family protein [Cytobacillus purgationiresistens]|uniref:Membrane protein n=1 Tax=Cytobacillus purgationiresistens TaxID=863449 RepID=A0ABU0AKG5_9BACI|nr:SdpI family protein [Cytobacillus purgationiresistens]MDQ0271742.1 putative membrane protein [Cytobacillus purgationiresistens]
MTRKIDRTLIITTLICLLPIVLAFVLYNKLPDQIAIHWDSAGTPDNFAPKAIAVWGLPLLMAGINIFSYFMIQNDPKNANASSVLKQLGLWILPITSVIIIPVTLFKAIGYNIPIQTLVPVMVGVIIIVCGNYLPKSKQSYTVGIKLPWTLHSKENWNRTHRMAGFLWVFGGVCMVIGGFLNINWLPITLLLVAVLVGLPFMYSYSLYKKGI